MKRHLSILCIPLVVCCLLMLNPDVRMASAARGHRLLTDPVQWLSGNATFGFAAIYSDILNKMRDNFWRYLIPFILVAGLLQTQATKSLVFMAGVIVASLLVAEVNSVSPAYGFWIVLALCMVDKKEEKI